MAYGAYRLPPSGRFAELREDVPIVRHKSAQSFEDVTFNGEVVAVTRDRCGCVDRYIEDIVYSPFLGFATCLRRWMSISIIG
jgi:hypothetical protein